MILRRQGDDLVLSCVFSPQAHKLNTAFPPHVPNGQKKKTCETLTDLPGISQETGLECEYPAYLQGPRLALIILIST